MGESTAARDGIAATCERFRALGRAALVAVMIVVLSLAAGGCSSDSTAEAPEAESTTTTEVPRPEEEVVAEAITRVQTALGLGADAVTRSKSPPDLTEEADVLLRWEGGRAEVDVETGRVLSLVQQKSSSSMAGPVFTQTELDTAAQGFAELMGWGVDTLDAEGFAMASSGFIDHLEGADEFYITWAGYDIKGAATGALLDIRLDASTKSVRSFLFIPPVEIEGDATTAD